MNGTDTKFRIWGGYEDKPEDSHRTKFAKAVRKQVCMTTQFEPMPYIGHNLNETENSDPLLPLWKRTGVDAYKEKVHTYIPGDYEGPLLLNCNEMEAVACSISTTPAINHETWLRMEFMPREITDGRVTACLNYKHPQLTGLHRDARFYDEKIKFIKHAPWRLLWLYLSGYNPSLYVWRLVDDQHPDNYAMHRLRAEKTLELLYELDPKHQKVWSVTTWHRVTDKSIFTRLTPQQHFELQIEPFLGHADYVTGWGLAAEPYYFQFDDLRVILTDELVQNGIDPNSQKDREQFWLIKQAVHYQEIDRLSKAATA